MNALNAARRSAVCWADIVTPLPIVFVLLSACATRNSGDIAEGAAAIGAAGGAALGAVVPGVNVIEGAAVGAAIGGLAGAVWADQNNDGYVDGYVSNGQYYTGTPQGYDPTLRRVATGALGGAALGAVAGAVIPGVSLLEGAVIGAAVGGLAGAIWADRDNDGRVDGYVSNGQYYAGAPSSTAPAPTYTAPASAGERDDPIYEMADPPAGSVSGELPIPRVAMGPAPTRYLAAPEIPNAEPVWVEFRELRSVRAWHSANGTLTGEALRALVEECGKNWGGVGSECQAGAKEGSGNFHRVPESARNEFAYLVQLSCPADRPPSACVDKLESNRLFRSLPRGRLEPKPLKMNEGVPTRFTAYVLDRGQASGLPGAPTDEGVLTAASGASPSVPVTLIPMSARMCFVLTAEDPTKVRIQPIKPEKATIEHGHICMDVAEGGGALKFDPSWLVTPTSGEDLRLYLDTEYFIKNERRKFEHRPRPLVIDVIPKPTPWERVNAFFRRATETVGLAGGLAKALGVLFAAVMGWGIWSLSKRRGGAPSSG